MAVIGAFISVNQALETRSDRIAVEDALEISERNLGLIQDLTEVIADTYDVSKSRSDAADLNRFVDMASRATTGLASLSADCIPFPEREPSKMACQTLYTEVLSGVARMRPVDDELRELHCLFVDAVFNFKAKAGGCADCGLRGQDFEERLQKQSLSCAN